MISICLIMCFGRIKGRAVSSLTLQSEEGQAVSLSLIDRNDILTHELRDLLDRRLSYALSRYESRIRRKTVVIEDADSPRGGVDRSCQIKVSLDRAGEIVICEQDTEISKSIIRAAERIGRAVARAIERSQHADRRQPHDVRPM